MSASKALENLGPCHRKHPRSCMMKNNRSLKKPNAVRIMLCLYVQAIAGDSDNTDQATHKTGSTSPSSDCCNCQTSTATPAKPGGLSLTLESADRFPRFGGCNAAPGRPRARNQAAVAVRSAVAPLPRCQRHSYALLQIAPNCVLRFRSVTYAVGATMTGYDLSNSGR